MAPSPDRRHIALQLAERADENAYFAVLHVRSGQLRRFPDLRCRYEPMLWTKDSLAVEFFARPLGQAVTYRVHTDQVLMHSIPDAATSRLFPGGEQGLVAISAPKRPTRLIDRASGHMIAQYPGIVRVAAIGAAALVDDGVSLHAVDPQRGEPLWSWDGTQTKVMCWTVAEETVFAVVVRNGRSVIVEIEGGRTSGEYPVTSHGKPAVATAIGLDDVGHGGVDCADRAGPEVSADVIHNAVIADPAKTGHNAVTSGLCDAVTEAGRQQVMLVVENQVQPPRVVRWADVVANSRSTIRAQTRGQVRTHWHTAHASDETDITVTVTEPICGPRPGPMILTCYGGFGVPCLPTFDPSISAWVEQGGRYAIAHVRGGGERGIPWHHAGRGEHKHRTVDDFVCAARSLIEAGYTRADQLVLVGASHGGVIVASAGLGHPELCAGIVSTAAPLDLLNLAAHPLGRLWMTEFGASNVTQSTQNSQIFNRIQSGQPRIVASPGCVDDMDEQLARLRRISPLARAQALTSASGKLPRFLGIVMEEDSRVAADDTERMVRVLRDVGAEATMWTARHTGHGSNHLDRVHDLAAVILSFAAATTGLRPQRTEKACHHP
ncbi:prolyl oligopeptidase family serine peptidase [Devriesea agamarum]|uniref:prolyl oligopeptidase family serine peptidase n=1 Tax=Devriesea agamarum TaxID=472569 RepID=UPI0012EE66DC|nr:prolyl oligopeptidase family serine peptidase [Devriesea agamarum]